MGIINRKTTIISQLGVALLSTLCKLGNGGEQGAQGAQGSFVVPGTAFTWGMAPRH